MSLVGKVCIVTGAAGGIGRATVDRMRDAGAMVLAVDLPGVGLRVDGSGVIASEADITQSADVRRMIEAAEGAFGGVDVLVNNAGVEGVVAPLTDVPDASFDAVIAVNLRGVWLGMKHAIPAMRRRGGGAIVNVASAAGLKAAPNQIAYVATKHAVVGMTRAAAIEFAHAGIRVNAVCPSPVNTRMMRAIEEGIRPGRADDAHARIAAANPMGRYAEPAEVATVIAFLASDDASYVNGAAVVIDGGLIA